MFQDSYLFLNLYPWTQIYASANEKGLLIYIKGKVPERGRSVEVCAFFHAGLHVHTTTMSRSACSHLLFSCVRILQPFVFCARTGLIVCLHPLKFREGGGDLHFLCWPVRKGKEALQDTHSSPASFFILASDLHSSNYFPVLVLPPSFIF